MTDDALAPARGVVFGILIAVPMWLGLVGLFLLGRWLLS